MSATPPGRACLRYLGSPRVVVLSELEPLPVSHGLPCLGMATTRRLDTAQARLAAKPDCCQTRSSPWGFNADGLCMAMY